MPRKKSGKGAAQRFKSDVDMVRDFVTEAGGAALGAQSLSWVYEAALLKTYVAFERLMLDCIVVAINNDTATISNRTGIDFPKHLTDEVCEYIVIGGGYFDFKGRAGLIKEIKRFVQDGHWLVTAVKAPKHTTHLDKLVALRNYAAHESSASKKAALTAVGQERMSSAGSWLKKQGRLEAILKGLVVLADDIEREAPY